MKLMMTTIAVAALLAERCAHNSAFGAESLQIMLSNGSNIVFAQVLEKNSAPFRLLWRRGTSQTAARLFSSGKCSRTNTRLFHGKVGLRYHDSVHNARQAIIASGSEPDRSQKVDLIYAGYAKEANLTVQDHDVLSLANKHFELLI